MSNADFDAQYAEVADEPRSGPIDKFMHLGGTFDEKLADLCQNIYERYEGKLTPLEKAAGGGYGNDQLREFRLGDYLDDMRKLTLEEFPVFFDAASFDRFADITTSLDLAVSKINEARGYEGIGDLQSLFQHWEGTAADHFSDSLKPLGTAMRYQIAFAGEIGAASAHYEHLMKSMRVDAYGLAKNLMAKVDPPDSGSGLETALLVAGLIAGGAALFASGPLAGVAGAVAVGEWGIAATSGLLQVQALDKDEVGDRAIIGGHPREYIPSCETRIEEILGTGAKKGETVMHALAADMKHKDMDFLFLPRTELRGMTEPDNRRFKASEGYKVDQVADLRKAGVATLPTMAQYFEEARKAVEDLSVHFFDGIGQSAVANQQRNTFLHAATTLGDSFTRTRDYLYEAGVAMTHIADNYSRMEGRHAEMITKYKTKMDNPDVTAPYDRYKPSKEKTT
ncbi:hypothetical protein EV193_110136 [Herbihabitans rhizosphaerae]|uniref:Uncharacterized protein n=1 Tax=Herbihabitans rhizosphaerae TaxID=1872711 RepID=A0A4Q7KJD8_9PSEU|nr:hypothetical protein [Herbihabitans rhizosphaerae]RZS33986.1 hypothetical protein EV193_110136 [Herbihabitans rhizosphaerae]